MVKETDGNWKEAIKALDKSEKLSQRIHAETQAQLKGANVQFKCAAAAQDRITEELQEALAKHKRVSQLLKHLVQVEKELEQRKDVAVACGNPTFQFDHEQHARINFDPSMSIVGELDRKLKLIEQAFAEAKACGQSTGTAEGTGQAPQEGSVRKD